MQLRFYCFNALTKTTRPKEESKLPRLQFSLGIKANFPHCLLVSMRVAFEMETLPEYCTERFFEDCSSVETTSCDIFLRERFHPSSREWKLHILKRNNFLKNNVYQHSYFSVTEEELCQLVTMITHFEIELENPSACKFYSFLHGPLADKHQFNFFHNASSVTTKEETIFVRLNDDLKQGDKDLIFFWFWFRKSNVESCPSSSKFGLTISNAMRFKQSLEFCISKIKGKREKYFLEPSFYESPDVILSESSLSIVKWHDHQDSECSTFIMQATEIFENFIFYLFYIF